MKVFVTKPIPDIGIHLMQDQGIDVTIWDQDRPLMQQELIEITKQHSALLSVGPNRLDANFLKECRHLKVIALYSVGYDHIDVEAAVQSTIPVANTPNVLSDATTDIAFILMLAVSRKAFYMHKQIINGAWNSNRSTKANLGIELKNKTLGILGLGRIGQEMAKRCKGAYNMNILYCNRAANMVAEEELQATKVSFAELLQRSDVLSVHCSLTAETKGVFDLAAFKKMKPSAIFINTARGQIHQEQDLIKALQDGIIWGAGLDVTNPEPMKPDNPLLFMPNVAVLPHIGSATVEARNAMARLAAENIICGLKGERLPNIVNPEVY
ncbi:2-hydroxyacid dehydrogenase [Pontibacter silvestris]|uniref:2-hydroxyacid dehydrogenase n=1 Tax=Pontibacter silvestris TaxID=2305183 RepID=A0ABW4WYQ1_9BACT|nr:D-glycerate dehydrogenase [Pontibacter silvestris]MCC9135151.1 D-glycerate dehydrogenase [Pontibacter silvestris]